MISYEGIEFDETKYEGLNNLDSLRLQFADGIWTLDGIERRMRELEAEIESVKFQGLAEGVIPITPMMIAAGQTVTAMRTILAENGREIPEPAELTPSQVQAGIWDAQIEREAKLQKSRDEHAGVEKWDAELNAQIWDD